MYLCAFVFKKSVNATYFAELVDYWRLAFKANDRKPLARKISLRVFSMFNFLFFYFFLYNA